MRIPACPVAPATKTVEGSLRLAFPNEKPGEELLDGTGIKEVTSGIFPKSKRKGLELEEASLSSGEEEEEESSLGLPIPNDGNDPDFLAKTLSLGFRRVNLEWGVVVRRDELDIMDGFPRSPSPSIGRSVRLLDSLPLLYLLSPFQSLIFFVFSQLSQWERQPAPSQLHPATYSYFILCGNIQHQTFPTAQKMTFPLTHMIMNRKSYLL